MLTSKQELNSIIFSIEGPILEQLAQKQGDYKDAHLPVCKFYQKGTCMRGNDCPYRHARTEKSQVVCKHWLRGLCKKTDNCEFLHEYDLSKMPPCHFFTGYGACFNADCPFLHTKPEDRMKECPWYRRGFCKLGPNCKHKHVQLVACASYLAGFCPDGPNCKFGHPKFEVVVDPDDRPQASAPSGFGAGMASGMGAGSGHASRSGSGACFRCGLPGHLAAQCPSRDLDSMAGAGGGGMGMGMGMGGQRGRSGLRALEDVTCFKCGEVGHYANACPNPRRIPPPGGWPLPPSLAARLLAQGKQAPRGFAPLTPQSAMPQQPQPPPQPVGPITNVTVGYRPFTQQPGRQPFGRPGPG